MGLKSIFRKGFSKAKDLLARFKRPNRSVKNPTKRLKSAQKALQFEDKEAVLELQTLPHREEKAAETWSGPPTFDAFQEFSNIQLSPHTQRAYENDLRDFLRFLLLKKSDILKNSKERRLFSNVELNPQTIGGYRDFLLHDRKLSHSSITRKLAVLKSFFKYSVSRQWLKSNPADYVKGFPQTQESKTGFLNDAEMKKLFLSFPIEKRESLSKFQAEVLVKTLAILGIRRSEARNIKLKHLDYNNGNFELRVQGKGSRERRLPLSPLLLDLWELWMRRILNENQLPSSTFQQSPIAWISVFKNFSDQALFINTKSRTFDSALSTSEMGHIVRKCGNKAGIPQRLSPHMLRASAITSALDSGATHRGVQQMAGWTSPLMISRYDKRLNDPKFSGLFHIPYAGWSQAQSRDKNTPESQDSPKEIHEKSQPIEVST